jgi:hypothetical protein
MIQKALIFGIVATATFALAQNASYIAGAVGRGIAVSDGGVRGKFNINVKKAVSSTGTAVSGTFSFETGFVTATSAAIPYALICDSVRQVDVVGRICTFSGPAKLVRRSPLGPITIQGIVQGSVEDADNTISPSLNRDKLKFRFTSTTAVVLADFNGVVREGDIRVFRVSPNP